MKSGMRPQLKIFGVIALVGLLFTGCVLTRKDSSPAVAPIPDTKQDLVSASHYGEGDGFDGKTTASGEKFDADGLTTAHKELPFNSVVEVTNPENGKSVHVRVNDRGPHVKGRSLDLSSGAAKQIGIDRKGVSKVKMRVVKKPE